MTTFLVHEAKREGFESLLVFDADEFFASTNSSTTLAQAISEEMGPFSHLKVDIQDFMVERAQREFSLKALGEAQPNPKPQTTSRSNSRVSYLVPKFSLRRMGKVILNLNKWKPNHIVVTGNHFGSGLGRKSRLISLLHLPFWSRQGLNQRVSHYHNLVATPLTSRTGSHLRQIAEADQEAFWISKTWTREHGDPSGEFAPPDPLPTEFSSIGEKVRLRFTDLEESLKLFQHPAPANSIAPDLSRELDQYGALLLNRRSLAATAKQWVDMFSLIEVNLVRGSELGPAKRRVRSLEHRPPNTYS